MPPRRRATTPEPLDMDRVREDLAAGKTVRVAIASSAQFPDGASGRVRGLGDPEVVGAEFVEVEVAVNGVKDVVPFAPTDLAPPAPRRRSSAEPGAVIPAQRPAPPPAASRPAVQPADADRSGRPIPGGADPSASPDRVPPALAGTATPRPGSPRPAGPSASAPAPSANGAPSGPSVGAASSASSGSPAAKAGGRRPARAITVTLTTSEAEPTVWRVEARIGAKVVLKATPVSPARAWDLVQSLDNEALSSAVGAVLEQHRQATAARAQALAAELAAVQAELAALPTA